MTCARSGAEDFEPGPDEYELRIRLFTDGEGFDTVAQSAAGPDPQPIGFTLRDQRRRLVHRVRAVRPPDRYRRLRRRVLFVPPGPRGAGRDPFDAHHATAAPARPAGAAPAPAARPTAARWSSSPARRARSRHDARPPPLSCAAAARSRSAPSTPGRARAFGTIRATLVSTFRCRRGGRLTFCKPRTTLTATRVSDGVFRLRTRRLRGRALHRLTVRAVDLAGNVETRARGVQLPSDPRRTLIVRSFGSLAPCRREPASTRRAQVGERLGGDPLAGQQRGDARRVAGDRLARDPPDGVVDLHNLRLA